MDKKTGQEKRRSKTTKNEYAGSMLQATHKNKVPFKYVLTDIWFASAENMRFVKLELEEEFIMALKSNPKTDIWFASAENMRFVKLELEEEFIMALKSNRKVALSEDDHAMGQYQRIDQLELPAGTTQTIYLEGVPFQLHLVGQVFTNEDGSTGVRYLVSSDMTLDAEKIIPIYQKRWKVEEDHRSLKQNGSLAKSPTRTETTQTNHFVAALWSFVKIELLKVQTNKNHYQLKAQVYFSALQQAFQELRKLHAELPQLPSSA